MIYISDIDGTIADISHRLHYIRNDFGVQDWPAFFKACADDKPIHDIISLLLQLRHIGHRILYLSGRSDEVEAETVQWLFKHECPSGPLYMRKAGDHRQDYIVKSELLDKVLEEYPKNIIAGVFEDRSQVVKMYRERGLRVFQVADGEF